MGASVDQKFKSAIISWCQFPPPETLHSEVKTVLIFNHFDRDRDGFWNSEEFDSWHQTCHKDDSADIQSRKGDIETGQGDMERERGDMETGKGDMEREEGDMFRNKSMFMNDEKLKGKIGIKCDVTHLESLYASTMSRFIDRDFATIFDCSLSPSTLNRGLTLNLSRRDLSVFSTQDDSIDDDPAQATPDLGEAFDDGDIDDADAEAEIHGDGQRETQGDGDDFLEQNINAVKLRYIFKHLTKRSRGQYIEALTQSLPFLAEKIVLCQQTFLEPLFGDPRWNSKPILRRTRQIASLRDRPALGSARPQCTAGQLGPESGSHGELRDSRCLLTLILEMLFQEAVSDFVLECRKYESRIFDEVRVNEGISRFYDQSIVTKIQLKIARLVDIRSVIGTAELHPDNAWIHMSGRPTHAKQAINTYNFFRSRRLVKLRRYIQVLNLAGQRQLELTVSLVTQTFVESGVIRQSEVTKATSTVVLTNQTTQEVRKYTNIPVCLHAHKYVCVYGCVHR